MPERDKLVYTITVGLTVDTNMNVFIYITLSPLMALMEVSFDLNSLNLSLHEMNHAYS